MEVWHLASVLRGCFLTTDTSFWHYRNYIYVLSKSKWRRWLQASPDNFWWRWKWNYDGRSGEIILAIIQHPFKWWFKACARINRFWFSRSRPTPSTFLPTHCISSQVAHSEQIILFKTFSFTLIIIFFLFLRLHLLWQKFMKLCFKRVVFLGAQVVFPELSQNNNVHATTNEICYCWVNFCWFCDWRKDSPQICNLLFKEHHFTVDN